jgi:hypothetical protein
MNLVKLQMLWCIIPDVLMQKSIIDKGLSKYFKVNGIIPLNIHV